MVDLRTISAVSRNFNLSTRTLRYYEQIGILESTKKEDYSYRTYDEKAIKRLQQIVVLRKLRIPLKQIKNIYQDPEKKRVLEIFHKNLSELDDEIFALSTIRTILNKLISQLKENVKVKFDLLEDNDILRIVEPLSLSKIYFKEEKSMEELKKANESLNKLNDNEVRIIYLPPSAVASIHCIGGAPEIESGNLLNQFIKDTNLFEIKPDLRHYGFNNPNGNNPDGSDHGYERWITVPDNLGEKAPFVKKYFNGGLYCAYSISMGNFEDWFKLINWAQNNDQYELNFTEKLAEQECMEEHLNYINKYMLSPDDSTIQIDLLLPIKEK